jgi:cell fate (sporulation/competence/biofilm development) regulator YlbF (YheA/YmcA/DUF963 family)
MSSQTADLEALGRELGEAIAASPEHEAFEEAREAVEADSEAQERIEEFERLRREFALARERGDATETDLHEVERAQQELHDLPVMDDYLEAKERLSERLEAVNEAVSEPLAVDFGGEAGGCCHD